MKVFVLDFKAVKNTISDIIISMKSIEFVILAAGKGTRMKSDLPKVLHKICGKPLLHHVLNNVEKIFNGTPYVVIGHKADKVKSQFKNRKVFFVLQPEQLGTGHALMQTEPFLNGKDAVIVVLNGDMPLISSEIISSLIEYHKKNRASATVLTVKMDDPTGYGRIVRNRFGHLEKIVEHKDASLGELEIKEINTGTYCFEAKELFKYLHNVRKENAQHEYYLTDVIDILRKNGKKVSAYMIEDQHAAIGINTKEQLAEAERIFKSRYALQ